jgi:hypothetical protein
VDRGRTVYAQVRVPKPRIDGPRYLNPTAELARNPRLSRVRPVTCDYREIVVTEGAIDALSAAAAGYRAVAVLGAAYADEAVALELARLPHPLVLVFDADEAGATAGRRLAALLQAHRRPPVVLDLGHGDINDALLRSGDWTHDLAAAISAQSRTHGHEAMGR